MYAQQVPAARVDDVGKLGFRPSFARCQPPLDHLLWLQGESGKPTITAKMPFAVKHLHRNPRRVAWLRTLPMGLDCSFVSVDNYGPPSTRGSVFGGS